MCRFELPHNTCLRFKQKKTVRIAIAASNEAGACDGDEHNVHAMYSQAYKKKINYQPIKVNVHATGNNQLLAQSLICYDALTTTTKTKINE